MHPLAPHYERNTGSDHGKKRPCESNASSSSTTLNHPSSSCPLDDTIDVNNDESFHSNSSSPSKNVSSPSNVLNACKTEEGQLVSSHVPKMKSYIDKLELLVHHMPHVLVVNTILDPRILTSKEVNIDNMTLEEYELYELAMSKKKSEVDNDSMIIEEDELYMAMQCCNKKIIVNTTREKDEVRMEDVEMDEDHEVDHSKTKEVLQWIDNETPLFQVNKGGLKLVTQTKISASWEALHAYLFTYVSYEGTLMFAHDFQVGTWMLLDEAYLKHVTGHAMF
ncbi:hypothetical protein Tco_0624935 [Tanacetum coccineum]|uniref:Uncharacterized protein n=1 Tax=Tanacetum coccineum TaxID=301880 RepID=A0ABQ4WFC3_9ASTR